MMIENLSFPEALRRVAEKAGISLPETYGDETFDANAHLRSGLFKLHDAAAKFFAAQLMGTSEGRLALAYLGDRGLSEEVIGRFRLGYAPSDGQSITRHLAESGFEAEAIEKSGLVLHDQERKRRYDRFRRRIIFPISYDRGKVLAFAGRALGDDLPKYLNSPETPIYSKGRVLYHLDQAANSIRKLDYAILVEGYMDCIAVASSGIENVVASCGTSLTESQTRLLARSMRRVVVNYDPDSAGVAATERSLGLLLEEGFEAKVLALPRGLDPDSFIRREGNAAYRERLAAAPNYLDYLTDRAMVGRDLQTPEGKVAAANAVLPYLAKVPNPLLRSELGNRLAERLHLDERLLRDELRRASREGRAEVRVREEVGATEVNHAVKQLLRLCLESDPIAEAVLPELVSSGAAEGLAGEGIFTRLWEARQRGEKLDVTSAEANLTEADRRLAIEALFWPGGPPNLEVAQACLRKLQSEKANSQTEKLSREYAAAVSAGDWAKAREVSRIKSSLDKELRRPGKPPKNPGKSQRNGI